MIGSLYSGISGLKANTSAMSVIGDNIANVDTTGFKVSKVSFSNVFSASLGQSSMQIGRGVVMSGVAANWNSGTMETTSNATDLAINGQGMFIVNEPNGSAQYYTRAGQFEFDNGGYLVNQDGFRAQGYPIDAAGNIGTIGDITLPDGMSVPSATDEITMSLNLDSNATTDYDTTVTVYDSLGNPVDLTFTFTRDTTPDLGGAVEWDYTVTSSHATAVITPTTPTLGYSATGALLPANSGTTVASATGLGSGHTINITGLTPAADMDFTWRFMDTTGASDGSLTSYAGNSAKNSQTQNGYPTGMLQGISVDEDGIFTGLYSNGTMLSFAQTALADFACYSGLQKQGSNLFSSSLASGQAVVLAPNQGGVGSIAPSSLEMSNVDLATEFVELITTQRAFQANSKVITTSDEVLSELINIKR
ncbi:MAG: flagellar hook protein FlgE [Desulfobacteraceae bacterium]